MPRSGPVGTYSLPGAQKTQVPDTPIPSAVNNQGYADIEQTFNTATPIAYGGTNAGSAINAIDNLTTKGTDIATSGTLNLDTATGQFVDLTGTTTVTAVTLADGRHRMTRAAGDFQITVGASLIGNSGGSNVAVQTGDLIFWEGFSGGVVRFWVIRSSGQALVSTPSSGYLFGLGLANNVTDITNDIDIATGSAINSTNTTLMSLASGLTKRLDAAWAVGTNQGGLDTGSIGNNTYHVFLIMRPDTGVVDALFSLSATAPTLPTNYTLFRRIGSFRRTAGSIRRFLQDGDRFIFYSPVEDAAVTNLVAAPGTTFTLGSIPTGIQVVALITASMSNAATNRNGLVTALDQSDDAPGNSGQIWMQVSNQLVAAALQIRTNTSGQIRARSDIDNTTFRVTTTGYIDTRGRL